MPNVDEPGYLLAAAVLVMSRQGPPDAVTHDGREDVLTRLSALDDPTQSPVVHRTFEPNIDGLLSKVIHQVKHDFKVGTASLGLAKNGRVRTQDWRAPDEEISASGPMHPGRGVRPGFSTQHPLFDPGLQAQTP